MPEHPDLWPPVVPRVAEAVLDRALTPDRVACVVVAEGVLDLRPFSNPGYASRGGVAGGGREDDEDAWSGWGGGSDGREDDEDALSGWGGGNGGREDDEDAWSGFAGWVGWDLGGREVAAFPAWLGAWAPLFRLARLGGTGGSGAGGPWGLKNGCVACWP